MRIALVNWARIWDGASNGGGVNGYCQALALSLVDRGHEVTYVFGGTTYVHEPKDCILRRHDDWLGIRVFEFVNSPVIAPSIRQYQDPAGEMSSPELENRFAELMSVLRPQVVHFHNIEGFSAGCITTARAAGARVVFSLHNYHTICPQVYLMQGHRRVCHNSENGHNCVECIPTTPPESEKKAHADAYDRAFRPKVAAAPPPPPQPKAPDPIEVARNEHLGAWGEFKHQFSYPVRIVRSIQRLRAARKRVQELERHPPPPPPSPPLLPARPPLPLPGHAVIDRDDATSARLSLDDNRGQTKTIRAGQTSVRAMPDPREAEPLLNLALADPPTRREPNAYGLRRARMIQMLNECDRVLAVSSFVRDKFCAMGVRPDIIERLHIGTRVLEVVEQNRELLFDPPPPEAPPWSRERPRPLRLVFMGYNNYYKGLHVLAAALERLAPEILGRIELSIYALDGKSIEWVFRRLEPRLARLVFVGGYNYSDIPWMLGGKDVGIVSSVWWDNAPQTVFEFLACRVPVIGAEVGGIPDFITSGHNGLLFRGNDSADLASKIESAVRDPWQVQRWRSNITVPKTIGAHAAEIESLYAGLMSPQYVCMRATQDAKCEAAP